MNKSKVSIASITYNHEKYILAALESWIKQETDFNFEIVIGEDASSDYTRNIIEKHMELYPDKIRLITSEKNVGIIPNFIRTIEACQGEHIAFCEGDDYWTDPYKLQKQVDFLEANPEYSLCFHNAMIKWENDIKNPQLFCSPNQKETSTIEDVINNWFIPTASMMFRRECVTPLPVWIRGVYNGDWALQMILADKGKIKYLPDVMSVYRRSVGSLSGGVGRNTHFVNNKKIELLGIIDKETKYQYSKQINTKVKSLRKDIKQFELRKRNKILYWVLNPAKLWKKSIDSLQNFIRKDE